MEIWEYFIKLSNSVKKLYVKMFLEQYAENDYMTLIYFKTCQFQNPKKIEIIKSSPR